MINCAAGYTCNEVPPTINMSALPIASSAPDTAAFGRPSPYRVTSGLINPLHSHFGIESFDKERLGSNPLTCLMDHASVKMRNLEASLFKPNSPNRENLFRVICTPPELNRE